MRITHIVGVVLIAFAAGILGGFYGSGSEVGPMASLKEAKQETAYDRVMRTGTLRCGYVVHPPHVLKDPATGDMSGSIVDILNEAGRLLNIKIEWPEEVGWGNTVEALRSGRIDAVCTDFFMNPIEGRYVSYSMPLYFEAGMAYVRADDHRFDKDLEAINDPSVTVSATDGSLNGIVAQQDFPNAKIASLPNMTDSAQVLIEVDAGKADVAFMSAMDGILFERNNPGRLKNLTADRPLRTYPVTIALPQNDLALKTMLDSAFVQLLYSRFVDKTLDKYGLSAEAVFRVARPYEAPAVSVTPPLAVTPESAKTVPTQQ